MSNEEGQFRMKNKDMEQSAFCPMPEEVEKARAELRTEHITDEELECARREAVNGLMIVLKVNPNSFRRLWLQPLMKAGATLDMALACIAKSCFNSN